MKLQRTLSNDEFYKFTSDLKNLFKDRKQKQRFGTFMVFTRRFLSVAFNKEKLNTAKNLSEVIRMVKTFVDYERENNLKEGKLSQALNTCVNAIKRGLDFDIIKDLVNLPEKDFEKIYPQALKLAV